MFICQTAGFKGLWDGGFLWKFDQKFFDFICYCLPSILFQKSNILFGLDCNVENIHAIGCSEIP